MNRIDQTFKRLKREGKKGLITYISAGDPNLAATARLAKEFERVGVDLIELGVPFSDPLADGIVNQLAAQRALEAGVTPRGVLDTISKLRQEGLAIPIVLYIYYNVIHKWGLEPFAADAIKAGVDGILPLDLPPEEKADQFVMNSALHTIRLIAPTTPEERIARICKRAKGFIYYVSREGVTGMQTTTSDTIGSRVALIRKHTKLPIAVGFGISDGAQARSVADQADAAVVGSAIVTRIGTLGDSEQMIKEVTGFVESLVKAVKA
ncbi:MAG: tryptophan synthase subunit alpha [Verrucomicrobiae bacterium]|nr:tryptophan synthase subunit alpha [Verrucomicrobiae bacterium]